MKFKLIILFLLLSNIGYSQEGKSTRLANGYTLPVGVPINNVFVLIGNPPSLWMCNNSPTCTQNSHWIQISSLTSVALTVPTWLTVTGSPLTANGTLVVTAATGQTSHQVVGTCGTGTTFAPCALVAGDLPTIPLSGLAYTPATIVGDIGSAYGTVSIGTNLTLSGGVLSASGGSGTVTT